MTTIQQFLPKDLVEEILCHISATSIKRLRTTCKRWNRLLNNTRFISKHSDKAAKQFLVLMLTKEYVICPMSINLHGVVPSVKLNNKLKLLDQFDITEVFHCDGLLLLRTHEGISQYESKIVVWNPLTGQTRWIEVRNVSKNNRRFVLGYSQATKSCSKSYKILSFTNDGEESVIYEFNSDSWRSIHDVGSIVCSDQNVSLKGNIYWFAHEKGIHLLRFDFSTEKTSARMTLPYHCKTYETLSVSVVREEKLCMLLKRDVHPRLRYG